MSWPLGPRAFSECLGKLYRYFILIIKYKNNNQKKKKKIPSDF